MHIVVPACGSRSISALRAPILALLTLFENHRLALLALSENHRLALLALSENHRTHKSDAQFRSESRTNHNEIKHAARVLSRYRDARRTRILRIRLRLTVRVKKVPEAPAGFWNFFSIWLHAASNMPHQMIQPPNGNPNP